MNRCIIFDTNFIYENLDLEVLFSKKNDDEDYFISDIVIEEMKGKNYRGITKIHDDFQKILENSLNEKYLKIKGETNLKEALNNSDKKVEKYYKSYFKKNIISIYSKERMYDDLMARSKKKISPFIDVKGSSDKGFKDTLIWMTTLNFAVTSEYMEFILVTSDKGFINNNKNNLISEFKELIPDKNIRIMNNFEFNKMHPENTTDIFPNLANNDIPVISNKKEDYKKLSEQAIKEYRKIVMKFFFCIKDGGPFQSNYEDYVFTLDRKPDFQDVVEFLDVILEKRNQFIFHESISFYETLSNLGYEYIEQYQDINKNVYTDLIDTYNNIKTNYLEYIEGFINLICDNFCRVEIQYNNIEDNLPF